jgi:short-subunit dehydrogenase
MKPIALITGASGGIGLAFARILAREGYDLVLVARSKDKLETLALELQPAKVTVILKDLSLKQAPPEIYEELRQKGIIVDTLINNAGLGDYGFFQETEWKKQSGMIDLNIQALTHLCHLFGKDMVMRRNGHILNVASTAAFQPGPLMSVYYASKAYVLSFTEAISNEWKEYGVTVTALCPGPTESGFWEAAGLKGLPLINRLKMPGSDAVAEYGYRSMKRGKTVAIYGILNTILATAVRFTPRSVARAFVRKIQS